MAGHAARYQPRGRAETPQESGSEGARSIRRRLFALGYATGGDVAHELGCQRTFSAIATISAAEFEESCVGDAVPFLRIYGRNDANSPSGGGIGCGLFGNTRDRLSVDVINERWRARNDTEGEGTAWGPREGGRCEVWRGRASFVSCVMSGGRYIELDQPEIEEPGCEDNLKPNSFPATRAIMRFFAEEGRVLE